jgi:hypothetical protein
MDPADWAGETYIGAPGWPELALKVASTWRSKKRVSIGCIEMGREASVEIWAPDGGAADDGGVVGEGNQRGAELTARSRMVLMASLSRSV